MSGVEEMEKLLNLFLFWEVLSSAVLSYPSGKINVACNSMLPRHGDSISQTSPPPYAISISSSSFTVGDEIVVSLTATNDSSFKGFLLQARAIGGDAAVGSFRILNPNMQGLECNSIQNSSLSHTNRRNKQNVTAVWIAPPGVGHVVFRATVLQNFSVFWAQVESQVLASSSLPFVSIIMEEGCGTQKFCFSSPAGCSPSDANCYFMASEALWNNGFKFEMSGLSDGYLAIGFSDDDIMGNDDIYICGRNATGEVEVQRAFSTGWTTPSTKSLGEVEIIATSFNNGIVKCSFISRNSISTQSRDTDSLYYIFLTYGPSSARQILKHPKRPFITDRKVNISGFEAQDGTRSTPLIIKAHGALMFAAWMTTGSVGIVFARYLRSIKKSLHGKEVWFQMHLLMMLLSVVATIIAFILIFVSANGWSCSAGAHAIIGGMVMSLSFLQAVIAFFRPSLQNSRRFIFNWFHMLNALVIKILAVAAIFLGLQMLSKSDSQWMIKTMCGFVGWEAFMVIMLDVDLWLKKKGKA
ncbi:putative ferric-chelate reductase 1 [Varanus komodoensis]|nr:putative ferric-chelate reductase 1 [Varanus komodoensis]